ncbi:MAG: hypothetical protein QW331_00505 [Candidatus Woesearchaeota archaeon]
MGWLEIIQAVKFKIGEKIVIIGDSTNYDICDLIYVAMRDKSCDPDFLLLDAFGRPIFDSVTLEKIKEQLNDATFIVDGATYRKEEAKLADIVKTEANRLGNNYVRF